MLLLILDLAQTKLFPAKPHRSTIPRCRVIFKPSEIRFVWGGAGGKPDNWFGSFSLWQAASQTGTMRVVSTMSAARSRGLVELWFLLCDVKRSIFLVPNIFHTV